MITLHANHADKRECSIFKMFSREIVGGDKENNPDCKLLDLKTAFSEPIDKLMKREKQGVLKDTVILPACGAVAIRINSDNPGVWFFHCHIEWHLHDGLAAIINHPPSDSKPMETGKNQTVGCIVFDDSSESECSRNESTWKTNKEVKILNCYSDMGGTCIPVTDLTSLHERELLDSFYFHTYDVGDSTSPSFHFEVSIDRALFYENSIPCEAAVKSSSRSNFDSGTLILSLPTAKSVTIILRVQSKMKPDKAFAEQHPMHMHGHHFEVLEIVGGDKENNPDCKLLDLKTAFSEPIDKLMKREKQGVLKDTVILPACGAVAIRINSDNPGVWFFHCHIEWHLHDGLAAIINEGDFMFHQTSFPSGYPTCNKDF